MKKIGLSFGLSVVNAGKRVVNEVPELVCSSTPGAFRVTPPVSKALGISDGEYIMFISNWDKLDVAIAEKNAELVAWCNEQGIDLNTAEGMRAVRKELGICGIAKGIGLVDALGNPILVNERLSPKVRKEYVAANYDKVFEDAMNSENDELIASITAEGITKEQISDILASQLQGDKVQKFTGSKLAQVSGLKGTNVTLNFTDSNMWNLLKKDMTDSAKTTMGRSFAIDTEDFVTVPVNNGKEDVEVKVYLLGEHTDSASSRSTKDGETEEAAE